MIGDDSSLILSILGLLAPLGLALVAAGGVPEKRAGSTVLSALVAIGMGGFAYLATGFALQFGGIGLHFDLPGFEGLVWERPLFTTSNLARVGTYTGLYYLSSTLAAIAGPNVNGLIIQFSGNNYNTIMLVAAVFMVLALILMWGVRRGEAVVQE